MRRINPINALFPRVRQRILAATYGQPERWWFLSELAFFIASRPSSLQQELKSLSTSGLLRTKRDGNRIYFKAETDSPVFEPLRKLIEQTLGITEDLRESLLPLADKIAIAFIFGSVARAEEHTLSDVDLMIVGETGLSDLSSVMRSLEKTFGREINATCYSASEFARKVRDGNHFLISVLEGQKTFLIGGPDELDKLAGKSDGAKPYDQRPGNKRSARFDRS